MMFKLLLASLLVQQVPPALPPQSAPGQPAPQPQERAVFEAAIVLGASLSGGFGLATELGTSFDLADAIELALVAPKIEVQSLGSSFFFQDPAAYAASQIEKARASEPTLVIALDYAFWFGHGYLGKCENRMQGLERALQLLEPFECPVLLGDLPDARPALAGKVALLNGRPAIQKAQIPDEECLASLNERLHAWAAERPNVHIFPLNTFFAQVHSTERFELHGNVYDAERKQTLLQPDLLHPTYRGIAGAALSALDILATAQVIEVESVNWNASTLEAAIWDATEEARALRERKRAERAEKRKHREEDKPKADQRELCPLPL